MKQPKFKYFRVTVCNGEVYEIKAPASKVTVDYVWQNAWHYVEKQHNVSCKTSDIVEIVGIR